MVYEEEEGVSDGFWISDLGALVDSVTIHSWIKHRKRRGCGWREKQSIDIILPSGKSTSSLGISEPTSGLLFAGGPCASCWRNQIKLRQQSVELL